MLALLLLTAIHGSQSSAPTPPLEAGETKLLQQLDLDGDGIVRPQEAADAIEALDVLDQESPDAAEVARLRFVLGLSVEQAAEATGLAPRTVKKKWAYAKAWLRHRMAHQSEETGSND